MRITLASSSVLRPNSGISSYNRFLAEKLVERGHDLQIATHDDGAELQKAFPTCSLLVSRVPSSVREEPEWARCLFDSIVDFDPDVIINSCSATVGSLFPSFARRRICLSVSHFYNGPVAKIAAIYPHSTDWIVALSKAGLAYLAHYIGAPFDGLVVLYNSLNDLPNAGEVIRHKCQDESIVLCYPGGANRIKSPSVFEALVRRFADRRDVSCQWIGDPGGYRRRLRAVQNVQFSGAVCRQESERLISAAHVFVLPSRHEGCPMTLVEAMRSGTIPLVSDCPSAMREIVLDGQNGFVIQGNRPKDYVSVVRQLVENPAMRNALAHNARQTYIERLGPENWIESMERLFVSRRACSRSDHDKFRREYLLRIQPRPGRWYRPRPRYLVSRAGLLDRRPV